jgi:pimeloyl-ACP methyl ester carboxylesterase
VTVPEHAYEIKTADGIRLHALIASPAQPRAALVLIHGLTTSCDEHGAFPALRDLALRARLAVVRYDGRAHGRSEGTNAALRLAGTRADADAVGGLIDEQLGADLPVVPLGVSFGGAASVHLAATRQSAAGLAMWYPIIDYQFNYGDDSPVPLAKVMREMRSEHDPDWSAMPVADTGYHLPRALMEEIKDDRTSETLRALELPVLAYHGSRDWFVSAEPLKRIAAERSNVQLRIAYGAAHGFIAWRPWVLRQTVAFAVRVAATRPPR